MNETVEVVDPTKLQTEADEIDSILGSIDSPGSIDSGVAESSLSDCDISTPGSPFCSPFPEQEVCPIQQNGPSPLPLPTKGVDEKTIKKLLEVLLARESAVELNFVSCLLASILTNSAEKNPVVQSQPAPNVLPVGSSATRKRLASSNEFIILPKIPRTDSNTCEKVKPGIVIIEQPEKNYRARYESEGCRGPVHGCSDMTFPTIKVVGYNSPLWVTVYLATSNGAPHFHLLYGPGSTKLPCRNVTLSDGVPAIQVLVRPESGMKAILDCISLKRKRNFEADKELKRRGLNPSEWKSERKEACFVFSAEVPGSPPQKLICKSRIFQCTAPPGNPEIWWMKPEKGSATGGEEIGLIGKKFPKGFKVRFFGDLPSVLGWKLASESKLNDSILRYLGEKWEAYGEVDKSKSNQGACVVKSPRLQHPITSPLTVNLEVCNQGRGNSYLSSDSVDFTYIPAAKTPDSPDSDPLGPDNLPINDDVAELIDEMFRRYLPEISVQHQVSSEKSVKQEWTQILAAVELLHQFGKLTANQVKELKTLISLQETLLLEAFRSSRQCVSECEFLGVFRQYLTGLNLAQ